MRGWQSGGRAGGGWEVEKWLRAEINDTLAPRRDKVTCKRTLLYLNRVSIHLARARDANLGDGCRLFIINALSRRREVVVSSPTHQPPCACAYCVKCCVCVRKCELRECCLSGCARSVHSRGVNHFALHSEPGLFFLDCLLGKGFEFHH